MARLTVAAVQLCTAEGDWAGNMEKAQAAASRVVAGSQAELILFPELCIEGNAFADYGRTLTSAVLAEIDAFWAGLAMRHGRYILVGRARLENEIWYDSAICYAPSGEVAAVYDKAHLYDGERLRFRAGTGHTLLDIGGVRLGVLICADLGFPEYSRVLARNGADALLAVSAWCRPYQELLSLCCRTRAAENGCYLVSSNRFGPEPSGRMNCGHSMTVSPAGQVLDNLGDSPEGFAAVTVDTEAVWARRAEVPWLEWLRPELYGTFIR